MTNDILDRLEEAGVSKGSPLYLEIEKLAADNQRLMEEVKYIKRRYRNCQDEFRTMEELASGYIKRIGKLHIANEELRKEREWQPIETAPKVELQDIIVFNGEEVRSSSFWEGYWIDSLSDYMQPQPTHWQPLPQPPQHDKE